MEQTKNIYWRISCCIPTDLAESIAAECFELGALGTQSLDDDPLDWSHATCQGLFLPAHMGPVAHHTWIMAIFEPSPMGQDELLQQMDSLLQAHNLSRDNSSCHLESIVKPDLTQMGSGGCQVHKLTDGIWIVPSSDHTFQPPPGHHALRMDGGMAFGTGQHPTTAMCAQVIVSWYQTIPLAQRPRLSMADIGCGAGILSLVGALGQIGTILATDIDEHALTITQANIAAQIQLKRTRFVVAHVQEQTLLPKHLHPFRADLVVANLLANPLQQLAPQILAICTPTATLCLSGILTEQIQEVVQAYQSLLPTTGQRIASTTIHRRAGWAAIVFQLETLQPSGTFR